MDINEQSNLSKGSIVSQNSSVERHIMIGPNINSYINNEFVSTSFENPKDNYLSKSKNQDQLLNEQNCFQCNISEKPVAHVEMGVLMKLKDSTRKLICLLEEIQSKTHSKHSNNNKTLMEFTGPYRKSAAAIHSLTDIGAFAIQKLEDQSKNLQSIYVQEDEDNCSVYKRLTRQCHCINQVEYNDFIIHFNEETKFFTSNIGEIIKNMRILKKFLYMGGDYSKHALMFLNEGLSESTHSEKIDITQGCSHADVCNVFEDNSIVVNYISWPCKNYYYGDNATQALTANFLYKLTQIEEGRRYLNFSSKITNDIKKVLRKNASQLDYDTLETLNTLLNTLCPSLNRHINTGTYYCKAGNEGYGFKTLSAIVKYRQYMTLDEVFTYLDLLNNLSKNESVKRELADSLPTILHLFKNLLLEYDNSEMNIILTNILNNIVSRSMITKYPKDDLPKTLVMAHTATEPILMKNGTNQIPPKTKSKKLKKSRIFRKSTNKYKQPSDGKVWETSPSSLDKKLDRSRKFTKGLRQSVIVVPVED